MIEATGLDEAIAYFREFEASIDRAVSRAFSSENLRNIEAICNEITLSTVYARFEGDEDTPPQMKEGALAELVDGKLQVGMSMNPALLSISGPSKGQNTYAMFMLDEFFGDSFLRGDAKAKLPIPFLDEWYARLSESVPDNISTAIDREISR